MTLALDNRAKQTTTTTGTGTLTLIAPSTGFRSIGAAIGTGNSSWFVCDNGAGEWEIFEGTVTVGAPDTLTRTTVLDSSTGSAVNFSAGTKTVALLIPSEKAVTQDRAENLKAKTMAASGALDAVTYTIFSALFGSTAAASPFVGQTTLAVSTSATQILSVGEYGTLLIVVGDSGAAFFADVIICGADVAAPGVLISHTQFGAPAGRTYSMAVAGVLKLAMASGTYDIRVFGVTVGRQ